MSTLFQQRIILLTGYFIASKMVQTNLRNKKTDVSSAKVAPSKTVCQSSFFCSSSYNAGKSHGKNFKNTGRNTRK